MAPLSASQLEPESLRAGEYLRYYSPLHVGGDERGERISRVISVDPNEECQLRLDTGEMLPTTWMVKRFADENERQYPVRTTMWRKIRTYTLIRSTVTHEPDHRSEFVAFLRRVRNGQIGVNINGEMPGGTAENPIVIDDD